MECAGTIALWSGDVSPQSTGTTLEYAGTTAFWGGDVSLKMVRQVG